ncbi:MAG: carbohydrate ABC transporter substrate-binding protein [Gammaproteobacteria bacterium]|nr:carbohydrate ABC transporter substrate-binding protein [Gammaproteobacteria bacterium]
MKTWCQHLIAFLFATYAAPSSAIELVTWWNTPGEQRALEVFKQAYEQAGGSLTLVSLPARDKHNAYIARRVSSSNPPAAAQWLFGPELNTMVTTNVIRPIELPDQSESALHFLYPELRELASENDTIWALPVGVHIHNSIFYNKHIYDTLGLPYPTSWDQLVAQIPTLTTNGIDPVAASAESWQLRYLFQAILLGIGGQQAYDDLNRNRPEASFKSTLLKTAEIYGALRDSVTDHSEFNWTQSAKRVADGTAAMVVIGDYIHSEFQSLGKHAGVDYDCALSPGSGKTLIFGGDTFVLFRDERPATKSAQDLLARVVLDPVNQTRYIAEKGGLPVVSNVRSSPDDACANEKLQIWSDPDANRVLSGTALMGLRSSAINIAIKTHWESKQPPSWLAEKIWQAVALQ